MDKQQLKQTIDDNITTNGQNEITGEKLNDVLNDMVDSLGVVNQISVGTTTTGVAGTDASVTNSGTSTSPVLNFTIPRGADGMDGRDAVNPFKGWYPSAASLPSSPKVGDYAYVKGSNASDPATIYECTTAGTWSDSGRVADTSNVQTFASGEEVNQVHIVNDLATGGVHDVLSAEQGFEMNKMIHNSQGSNEFDFESVVLVSDQPSKIQLNRRTYGISINIVGSIGSTPNFGYIGFEPINGKKYKLSFDYWTDYTIRPSMRNSSKGYIDVFRDLNGDEYPSLSGSGHADWVFVSPAGVKWIGVPYKNVIYGTSTWLENITLTLMEESVTDAFEVYKTNSKEKDAEIFERIDTTKYTMTPILDGGEPLQYPVNATDGILGTNGSRYHTRYLETNGAKKIFLYIPYIGSYQYGVAFYNIKAQSTFISGVTFSKYSKVNPHGWEMFDVPEGANCFRYTVEPNYAVKYRLVVSTENLLQIYKDSAVDIIGTSIMRNSKAISDKKYIFTFAVTQLNIIGGKAYAVYFVSESSFNMDVIGHGGDVVCSEVDLFDGSVRELEVTIESTQHSDGTPINPTWIDYSTTVVTPLGKIADFAVMCFNNSNNPIYCYAIYDADNRQRNFTTCRLLYTPSGGNEQNHEYSLNNYRQMLYEMGYANSYIQSTAKGVDNINIHHDDDIGYYAVVCTSQNNEVLPIVLMQSDDMETWHPLEKLGDADANEIGAIYKDGIVYVAYRTRNNGMKWLVYDTFLQNTVSEGTFPVSKANNIHLYSKPDVFTFEGDIYMAVNIDPTGFGELTNMESASYYTMDARQQIAIYKVVNGIPILFRTLFNPTGINYFSFCEYPPLYATSQSQEPIRGQGSIYMAYSEDRRHIYHRQYSNIALVDVTSLFVNNHRVY